MHGVDLTVGEHLCECLRGTDATNFETRRQIELQLLVAAGLFLAAGEVFDAGRIDAVVILQDPAYPHRRRHLVFGRGDALADEVLRLPYPALRRKQRCTSAGKIVTEKPESR